MKIKFNGILEKKTGGCTSCGQKTAGKATFVSVKSYILPSGITKTFRVGQVEEVTQTDGNFLLAYNYDDANGVRRAVFEEA